MIVVRPNTLEHTQENPAQIWEVAHNSPVIPCVTVAIKIGGTYETILPKSIRHEPNKVVIEFSKPRTGIATIS